MRDIWTRVSRRRKDRLSEARKNEAKIRAAFSIPQERELTDSELLDAAKAIEERRDRKNACAHCSHTVKTSENCLYAYGQDFVTNEFEEAYPQCEKLAALYKQRRIDAILGRSGMGERFKHRTFATFHATKQTEQALRECQAFCERLQKDAHTRGVLLMGTYGCGKTHLAAAVVHRNAENGKASMFVVVPELLAKIRSSYNAHDGKADEIIEAAKDAPLLVLDDLGAEKVSDWVREQIYMLVNFRYEHELPVVITTNNGGKELEAELGRRTLSRLIEMTVPVTIKARDYRMQLAGQAMRVARRSEADEK